MDVTPARRVDRRGEFLRAMMVLWLAGPACGRLRYEPQPSDGALADTFAPLDASDDRASDTGQNPDVAAVDAIDGSSPPDAPPTDTVLALDTPFDSVADASFDTAIIDASSDTPAETLPADSVAPDAFEIDVFDGDAFDASIGADTTAPDAVDTVDATTLDTIDVIAPSDVSTDSDAGTPTDVFDAAPDITDAFAPCPVTDPVVTVGLGLEHSCAVRASGQLWCWGRNARGQLGVGDTTSRNVPTRAGTGTTWTSVGGGDTHGCGLQSGGTALCWGDNTDGRLGIAGGNRTAPTPVPPTGWRLIELGNEFTLGVQSDGSLWGWGFNGTANLGIGNFDSAVVPTPAASGADWIAIEAGQLHALGIQADGSLSSWGSSSNGQTGLGVSGTMNTFVAPTRIGMRTDWSDIAAGRHFSCAIATDGTLWCWGDNTSGQVGLGMGSAMTVSVPSRVGTATTWRAASAGAEHVCGIQTDGSLWCWGRNDNGQLGNGVMGMRFDEPVPIRIGNDVWAAVFAGGFHTCGIRADNVLFCWGLNTDGQIGVGDTTARTTPTPVCLP